MYVQLKKDSMHNERSLNGVILSKNKWTLVSKEKLEKLKPFEMMLNFCEDPKSEAISKVNEENEEESKVDLSTLNKDQIIDFIITNKISSENKSKLKKFNKESLILIAKDESLD
jgi:hypothetical protein